MNFLLGSRVKELQAMLFPIQPIHGGRLTCLEGLQELHIQQFGRLDPLRRETEEVSPFTVQPAGLRHQETGNILQALLDVISERVQHIEYNPTIPEPFYLATGKEPRPRPIGDEFGTVIFRYCPTTVTNYFNRSCVGGTPVLPYSLEQSPEKCVKEPGDGENNNNNNNNNDNSVFLITESNEESNDLRFESRFESGNLGKVVKVTDTYYQLYLRKDLYTQRHTQWYYFRISNTRSRTTYRLSIVNLCKEESLYNEGLRPLLYSSEDAKKRAVGWRRCGDNIAYYRNDSSTDQEKERHTLTFNVSFPYDRDTVYLAHCYPYTYSDLQEYLAKIVADPVKTRFTKLRLLCRTLAGNGVYYLTITAPAYDEEVRRKRGVVITARVHPGETPSSWTMKGIIDFLTGESTQAKELRKRFVFKLVPMLNPDGVIVGNNRCSLSGKDLNRQYKTVMRESYPSIWQTKLMIRRLLEECGVAIYCDLHAHSRKHNIFAYGCESKRNGCYTRLSEQVFPLMLHKNAADKFSFENCKFHVEKAKEGTGRVVVWSMGIQHSYTLEASMGGSKIGSRAGTHFSAQDYEQIGRAFCETLLDFFDQDPVKEKLRMKIIARLTKEGSSAEEPTNIDLTDYSSDEGDASDSTVSEEEEEFTYTELSWGERNSTASSQHLSVPPPSPSFASPTSTEPFKRRPKESIATSKRYSYAQRKQLLSRRAVIDLPTTDPGSDVYDYNSADYADEDLIKSTDKQGEGQAKEKDSRTECLRLPEIVRPRSVSFAENLIVCDEPRKKTKRPYCRRFTRTLRNPSAVSLKSQDIQIKLSSLRRQIWTGMPTNGEDDIEGQIDTFAKRPLSWGLSNFVSTYCSADNLLKSCSKKLESLDKMRKTSFKREHVPGEIATQTEHAVRGNDEKSVKKKRSRLKWQRAIGLSSRIKDTCNGKSSSLTIKAETLKLVSAPPLKQPVRPQRPDTRRKYRKNGTQTMPGIGKSSIIGAETHAQLLLQKQPRLFLPACQSFSSDEESSDSQKQRTTKKKPKKKKQQQKKLKTPQATRKKRATSSGKILSKRRGSMK